MELAIAFVLVLALGLAIQRGNTCTVVAVDEIVHRKEPRVALAIAYSWLWVLGGLTVFSFFTGPDDGLKLINVSAWCLAGGLIMGVGAVVNGACTMGTIARIGSGQWAFLAALPGFMLGCIVATGVFGEDATTHVWKTASSTSLSYPWIGVAALVLVGGLTIRRWAKGNHESFRHAIRASWDPRTATAMIAVLFVILAHVHGPWAYTNLLGDLAHFTFEDVWGRLLLLAALLGGAILGGFTQTGPRQTGPLSPRLVRCFVGGILMGVGFALVAGSFDSLTLVGQPLFFPFAWVGMLSCYVGVTGGVVLLKAARRSNGTRSADVSVS
jgi:toxin CptA